MFKAVQTQRYPGEPNPGVEEHLDAAIERRSLPNVSVGQPDDERDRQRQPLTVGEEGPKRRLASERFARTLYLRCDKKITLNRNREGATSWLRPLN